MSSSKTRYISLKHLLIDKKRCIGLQFYPEKVLNALVKSLPDVKWSNTFSMAYLPNTDRHFNVLFQTFKGVAWLNFSSFAHKKQRALNDKVPDIDAYRKRKLPTHYRTCPEEFFQKLEIRKYSLSTARSYISHFELFINHYKNLDLLEIGESEICLYIELLVRSRFSDSYINLSINSIKFYYETVLGMPNRFYSVERPMKVERLPEVIGKAKVLRMIDSTKNVKHRCILKLLYSSGLRRSEVINLKLKDIESDRMLIKVESGKGKKDRYTLLSTSLLTDLRDYYREFRPQYYLIEGPGGSQYSGTSIAKIVDKAAQRASIYKKVTPHMLRHSFATHLLEEGVDLRYIQALMGHNSTKTTEIYTHVAVNNLQRIKNLLD